MTHYTASRNLETKDTASALTLPPPLEKQASWLDYPKGVMSKKQITNKIQ